MDERTPEQRARDHIEDLKSRKAKRERRIELLSRRPAPQIYYTDERFRLRKKLKQQLNARKLLKRVEQEENP